MASQKRSKPVLYVLIFLLAGFIVCFFVSAAPFLGFAFHPFKLFGGEKTYLVILQNNYELRPTGGFISSFGLLRVKNFFSVSLEFEDVYGPVTNHPREEPPAPVNQLLAHPNYQGHTFRDANFNPHFPQTAADLQYFLRKTRPDLKIDGVFAVDFSVVENWLAALGKVSVNGEDFDSNHFFEQLENAVYNVDFHDLQSLSERKNITKELISKMMKRSFLPWNLPDVVSMTKNCLDNKHILLWFADAGLQKTAESKNWAGVLKKPAEVEDILAVVDANYGGGKSNRYISKTIFYDVDLAEGKAVLNVRFDHAGDLNVPLTMDYRGYLRAYVPASYTSQGGQFQGFENGMNFAGNIFRAAVRTWHEEVFNFAFEKKAFRTGQKYVLNLWRQPGTDGDFYNVTVRVPTGYTLISDDFRTTENIAVFRGVLTGDLRLEFEIGEDLFPPRVTVQDLREMNLLELEWNEAPNPSAADWSKWVIKDADIKNSEHDDMRIDSVYVEGRRLFIRTTGMTSQPEERYILEISGIADAHNNATTKRQYTFVQRVK